MIEQKDTGVSVSQALQHPKGDAGPRGKRHPGICCHLCKTLKRWRAAQREWGCHLPA